MNETLSVAQMLDNLEARVAFHRERRDFHAAQEVHHREQLAVHDAELRKVLQHFETFKAAAEAAADFAAPPPLAHEPVAAPPPAEEIPYFGNRPMLSRLIARVVEARPAGETFGGRAIAALVNQRYGEVLPRPAQPGPVSVVLRRLAAAGRIRQVQPGGAVHEGIFVRDGH
jgi:hypothetical protein